MTSLQSISYPLARFPIVLGLQLSSREQSLVHYWIGQEKNLHIHETLPSLDTLSFDLHFIVKGSEDNIISMIEYFLPMFVVLGEKYKKQLSLTNLKKEALCPYYDCFYQKSIMAIWSPFARKNIVFPNYKLPESRGSILVYEKNKWLKNCYRQILLFSGYQLQNGPLEFTDLSAILREADERKINIPYLVFNLQQSPQKRLEFINFWHHFTQQHKELSEKTRILFTMDSRIPSIQMTYSYQSIRKICKRIFHPEELILFFLEGLLIPAQLQGDQSIKVDDLLEKMRFFTKPDSQSVHYPIALPFFWLYKRIADSGKLGFLLKDIEEIS